ncbi:uncharacterized protein LOC128800825 [Vidua chalybeata]|uniref:uncharacterized protein LOC128800825 n=1 Tax=Vidua chalybeata TaxID=81927 RepID=UPI0023A860A3|nr:uncharacterized protein LOC128800825 [Vidua chalybeata]
MEGDAAGQLVTVTRSDRRSEPAADYLEFDLAGKEVLRELKSRCCRNSPGHWEFAGQESLECQEPREWFPLPESRQPNKCRNQPQTQGWPSTSLLHLEQLWDSRNRAQCQEFEEKGGISRQWRAPGGLGLHPQPLQHLPADKENLELLIQALPTQEVPEPEAAAGLIRQQCPAASPILSSKAGPASGDPWIPAWILLGMESHREIHLLGNLTCPSYFFIFIFANSRNTNKQFCFVFRMT